MELNQKFRYIIPPAIILFIISLTYAINTGITSETRSFEVLPVQHFSISLSGNWSLISTPYQLVNITTRSFVNSISEKNWTLKNYNSSGWKGAYFNISEDDWTLNDIERTYGYYIRLNSSSVLEIEGIYINKTNISLKMGWNMIGYPSNSTKNLSTALSSITGKWTMLWSLYNNTWGWNNPHDPLFPFEIKNLTPGRGYWINISEDTTLIINETVTL